MWIHSIMRLTCNESSGWTQLRGSGQTSCANGERIC